MTELPNFYPAHPEILLACAAMAYMMIGVFVREERAMGIVHYLSLAALIVVGIAVLSMRGQELVAFNGQFVSDDFTVFMKDSDFTGNVPVADYEPELSQAGRYEAL